MSLLFVGIDVSKGYADMECMNGSGTVLKGGGRFDDTPEGHRAVDNWLRSLPARDKKDKLTVGLESSGGLERNWLRFFKTLEPKYNLVTYLLNPLAVKRFLERDLHRSVTDPISARGIANYLRRGLRPAEVPYEPELQGEVTLYRCLRNTIGRTAQLADELQSMLPYVHPDLVCFCRSKIPRWVLSLMCSYPTADKLKRAKAETVAKIPYITVNRARGLIAQAKESVAAQTDPQTGTAMTFICRELLHSRESIEHLQKQLCEKMKDDTGVRYMKSIKGIGLWSAVCLRLEIGPIDRFRMPEALVSYAGLDPRIRQSGDNERHIGISRRGRRQIRAVLYPAVLAAIRFNPIIGEFYYRLKEKGKGHYVAATACMRKMLHLIYACWITQREFDPDYEKARTLQLTKNAPRENSKRKEVDTNLAKSLAAPISRREAAKRKKAATLPQTGISRRERGPGAASTANHISPEVEKAI